MAQIIQHIDTTELEEQIKSNTMLLIKICEHLNINLEEETEEQNEPRKPIKEEE